MNDIANVRSNDSMVKHAANVGAVVEEESGLGESSSAREEERTGTQKKRRRRPWGKRQKSYSHVHYKVYKRRWFGLAQLVLLNVVVSWDVSGHCFYFYFGWDRSGEGEGV
jgi:FLVCR family MFS transporter 7